VKIVVIGDSGVGKSCFLIRYVRDTFDEETQSTLGIEFLSSVIQTETHRIQLQLWDTAGQELFRTVTRGYYRGSAGAIILFDVSNRGSFHGLEKWIADVQSVAKSDVVLILVGNKCDLEDKRQVSSEDAKEFAQKHGMLYFDVSAKSGLNVTEAIARCVDLIEKNIEVSEAQKAQEKVDLETQEVPKPSCC
jgi:small GTP-binding protein